jgi:hypothetical protein
LAVNQIDPCGETVEGDDMIFGSQLTGKHLFAG